MSHSVFISYRQSDSKGWALLLRDALAARFGAAAIFLDKDGLQEGAWSPQLEAAVTASRAVLVLIGSTWLNASDELGNRRLAAPDDVHRREVATALKRGAPLVVIPILVAGTPLPGRALLPEDLRALLDMQAYELSDKAERRAQDLEQIVAAIARATKLVPIPIQRRHWQVRAVVVLRALGIGGLSALAAAVVAAVGSEAVFGEHLSNAEVKVIAACALLLTLVLQRSTIVQRFRSTDHALPQK
jgi:hypothetical protein